MRVLVVDDSRLARKRVKDHLNELKLEVTITKASDGLEALEAYKHSRADLIITDIEMPRMNGISLVEEIRKLNEDVNIVLISSVVNSAIVQIIKHDKYVDFIKKPFNGEVFQTTLEKIVHNL